MAERGAINGWRCDRCDGITYGVHVDEGVTPMFLGCRAEGKEPADAECKGMAVSLMYPSERPIPQHILDAVAWEWYAPDAGERASLKPEMLEHVEKGGLDLRPLTDAGRALLAKDGQTG